MTIQTFVEKLEDAFGEYKDGMRSALEYELRWAEGTNLDKLFIEVLRSYSARTPPSLGAVLQISEKQQISTYSAEADEWVSVCEYCGTRFSMDARYCPKCKEYRGTGKVARRFSGG